MKEMRLLVQVIIHQLLALEYQLHQPQLLIDQVDLEPFYRKMQCRDVHHNQYGELSSGNLNPQVVLRHQPYFHNLSYRPSQ